jgi:hypothetical protein
MAKKVTKVKRKTNAKTKPIIYLPEVVLHHVNKMYDKLQSDESICYIKQLLSGERIYFDWWARMKKRYEKNVDISRAFKKVEDEIESRIVTRTLTGRYSAPAGIFLLKAKYGFVDKVVQQFENEKDDNNKSVPLEIIIRGHKEVNDE